MLMHQFVDGAGPIASVAGMSGVAGGDGRVRWKEPDDLQRAAIAFTHAILLYCRIACIPLSARWNRAGLGRVHHQRLGQLPLDRPGVVPP